MSSNGHITLEKPVQILNHTPPGDSCPTIIFGVGGHLFKTRIGQYGTSLYLWTSEGWKLYYRWDYRVPLDPDLYDLAAKTVAALVTPRL
jgi:hypothetical protein